MWTFKSRRAKCVPVICMWGPPSETYTLPSAIPRSTTEHKPVKDVNVCQITLFAFGERNIAGEMGGEKKVELS